MKKKFRDFIRLFVTTKNILFDHNPFLMSTKSVVFVREIDKN